MCKKKIKYEIPSLEEVKAYWSTFQGINFTAEYFYYYYESLDWMVGKAKIKDWRQVLRRWTEKKTSSRPSSTSFRSWPSCQQHTAEERRQRLVAAETAIMEQKQREQAEREARLEEDRKNSVSYEEYVALRALNDER